MNTHPRKQRVSSSPDLTSVDEMSLSSCFCAGVVAQDGEHGRPARDPHALFHHGVVLLRRLQTREVTRQPPPGETAGDAATGHGESAAEHQISLLLVSCCSVFQAQRDYFGAHTYELLSNPGKFIHTNWTGHGGNVSSSSYNA